MPGSSGTNGTFTRSCPTCAGSALLALPVDPDLAANEAGCPRRTDELMAAVVHDFDPIRKRPVRCEPRAVAARSQRPATGRDERLHSAAPDPCLGHLSAEPEDEDEGDEADGAHHDR